MATNANSENTRSRMEQVTQGSVSIGAKKMSQVLGAFELLDFTMLQPILASRTF
jgi:hypothetical protein